MNNKIKSFIGALICIIMITIGIFFNSNQNNTVNDNIIVYEISNIPEYDGKICIEINNNNPKFSNEDFSIEEDYYSELENERVRNGNDKN